MGRLGSKFRNAFSPSKKPGSPIIKDPPKKHSATNHSVIDTRAVIAIRWLALAGQTIALMIVAFDFGFDVVTTTTHKSLRGPRGGMVLCKKEFASKIDKSVFPGLQGGPHMNAVAAIAVTLKKAQTEEFRSYAKQVLVNSKTLADAFMKRQASLVTGGTDNHMMVVDTVASYGLDGRVATRPG